MRRIAPVAMLALLLLTGCVNRMTRYPAGESDRVAVTLLVDAIGEHRLVLIGEMHGTIETPALVGDVIAREVGRGQRIVLALEISMREQASVDRYLDSAGNAADRDALLAGEHWQDPMHDGRDSAAMFALIERIRQLRENDRLISIALFDAGGGIERNRLMADSLRKVITRSPQAMLLVLTGNVHAMTSAPPWAMFDRGKKIESPMTMGRYLSDLEPLSINVDATSGESWNCMNNNCGPQSMPVRNPVSKPTLEYHGPEDSPWSASLTLRKFLASPPAVAKPSSGQQ